MRRSRSLFFVLLLMFGAGPGIALAQTTGGSGSSGEQDSGFRLEQNYPNPFNPETKIPFILDEGAFVDGRAVVSIQIFNVLQQFVAAPTALHYAGGEGLPVVNLEYTTPGRHEAFWDGRDERGNQVASGVYFMRLVVNGRAQIRKMFVTK